VDYIRANKDKYPLESLKQQLAKGGVSAADIDEAVRLALGPQSTPSVDVPAAGSLPDGMIGKAVEVVLRPTQFFRAMPRSGGYQEPALFMISMVFIALGFRIAIGLLLGSSSIQDPSGIVAFSIGGFIAALIGTPIAFALGTIISYAIWAILGSKQPLEVSGRCIAYMFGLLPLRAIVQSLPYIGIWLAIPVSLYGIYLFVPASTEAHGVKQNKALLVAGIFGALTFMLQLSGAMMSSSLRNFSSVLKETQQRASGPERTPSTGQYTPASQP
jgi:hypothetical protein